MSQQSTQFNPYGQHEKSLASLKSEMKDIARTFRKEGIQKGAALSKIVIDFTKITEQLTDIVKYIPVHAIRSFVGEIAIPYANIISSLSRKSSDQQKNHEISNLFRKTSQFIRIIAELVEGPFDSDTLEEWGPIFDAFVTAHNNLLKENGILLWKKTFGKVKVALKWPTDLREVLEKLPKKFGMCLPPDIKQPTDSADDFVDDDEAMDGLLTFSDKFKHPSTKTELPDSQSSFSFSQQAEANVVADKILEQKKLKACQSPKVISKGTPQSSRKRAGKMTLLDEESQDFTPITSTPPSGRRMKMTDRQKEILAAKRAEPNYMDEESQTGTQKAENIKKALTEFNYDVEDSMSAPPPNKSDKPEPIAAITVGGGDEKPCDSNRNSSKKALFNDSPFKSLPTVSSSIHGFVFDDTKQERLRQLAVSSSPSSPPNKRTKTEDSDSVASISPEISHGCEVVTDVVGMETSHTSSPMTKSRGRPKNIPEQCPEKESAERSSSKTISEPSSDSLNVIRNVTNTTERDVAGTTEASNRVLPLQDDSFAEFVPIDDLDSSKVIKSPPKTPRTPSILRSAKRVGVSESPMTERKKNRVHFGEDSLREESVSTPLTPRRRPIVEPKSPIRSSSAHPESVITTNTPSDIQLPSDPSPFYPNLITCQDKIDRILPNLVTLCRKIYMDSAKKSLQNHGVKTVGDFAALSKTQIEKLTWIKGKMVGAKNVLALHEKTWNSDQRVGEEHSGKTIVVVSESVPDNIRTPQNESDPISMETEEAIEPTLVSAVISKATESMNSPVEVIERVASPRDNTVLKSLESAESEFSRKNSKIDIVPEACLETSEVIKTPQKCTLPIPTPCEAPETHLKTPEASQSPSSPISTTLTTSAASTVTSVAPTPPRDGSAVVSRKNLAPIFLGKTREVKKEQESPMKISQRKQIASAENTFIEDRQLLHHICCRISNAHTQNQWPAENPTKLLSCLNKAAIVFKNIVQVRGDGQWDDVDFDDENNDATSLTPSVLDDIDSLVKVYKRFSRQHTSAMASCLPWRSVMDCMNESACILESIFLARTASG